MTSSRALRTAGRAAAALAVVVAAAVNGLLCLLIASLQCDESCEGGSWHDTPGAWQWSAIGVLGVASFVCALACGASLIARRPHATAWCLGLACAAGLVPWIMAST